MTEIQGHIEKWNKAARTFDWMNSGVERRYGGYKRALFAKSRGKVMLVAAGTGLDFPLFPPDLDMVAIDFSPIILILAIIFLQAFLVESMLRLAIELGNT